MTNISCGGQCEVEQRATTNSYGLFPIMICLRYCMKQDIHTFSIIIVILEPITRYDNAMWLKSDYLFGC